ncbi:hypothetical protein PIB30_071130 [Stylosanthes scabra]|uniref:Uncharacterized protein n=1 Tax=Stylosanthes scabra TaxID=79078 RepID=A0ABU6XM14_9FABA|nr:hypothetical protein [Stylosanthes scabra]
MPPGRGLAPWLRVPGAGSKFIVLLPQFPKFRLHRLHAMSQFLGDLGLIRARSTERSLGRSARSNPIEGTLSIALGWVPRGRLPILYSPESVLTLPLPVASLAVALRSKLLLVLTLIVAGVVGVNHAFYVLVGHC